MKLHIGHWPFLFPLYKNVKVTLDLSNGQRLDSAEMHARKSLHILEGPIRRNMDVKGGCAGLRKERRAVEKGSIHLEKTYIITHRMLVGI